LAIVEKDRVAARQVSLHGPSTPLGIDGWTTFAIDDLKACAKGVDGELPVPGPRAAKIEIDGDTYEAEDTVFAVHWAPEAPPCIAGLHARLSDEGKKAAHLAYLDVPRLPAGTALEAGPTPHLKTARCGF
jgi:hypothetical protein